MILWVLLSLAVAPPEHPQAFWLSARECEAVQEHKTRPEAWTCVPWFLPVDRK